MNMEFWNESYRDDPGQTAVRDFFIENEAAGLPPGAALDMGCGTADILLNLAAKGWDVTGVDFAAEAITLARKSAAERGLEATFMVGDTVSWAASRQYDLVFSTFAMPAGDDMPRVVANMAAALKPRGTLMICEWDPKMSAIWGFGDDDLHSIEAYKMAMPGLKIEAAETRQVPAAFASDDQEASVAFIRATKPAF